MQIQINFKVHVMVKRSSGREQRKEVYSENGFFDENVSIAELNNHSEEVYKRARIENNWLRVVPTTYSYSFGMIVHNDRE